MVRETRNGRLRANLPKFGPVDLRLVLPSKIQIKIHNIAWDT